MSESQDPKQVNNNDLRNAQFGGGLINAENVNAGRIGGDIWNIFFGQQTTPMGNPARPKNERLLLAAVKEEVTARLRQSLHNAVLINLGKDLQPQQVKRPWDVEVKIGLKPPEHLSDNTTILEVFDSPEIAGKLLILGAPGSGKTTTQLELAQALISRAEEQPDYPVPVLFNLSSWKDDRQSITDWLVIELKSKYGVSKKLGQEWLNNYQLLPLLDGLDELEPQRQELCVHAINQFLASEARPVYLVVCSRIEEYNNYLTQLQLNGAIYLQPLTNNQLCDYLTSINYIELWSTISHDFNLLELVKTPLLLSIIVLSSQELPIEKWQHLNFKTDRLQYLLDAYIGRMLTRNIKSKAYLQRKTPNARYTRLRLVWLSQKLQRESRSELLIEEMQPSWLTTTQRFLYFLNVSLILWLLILFFIIVSILFYFELFLKIISNNESNNFILNGQDTRSWFFIVVSPLLGLSTSFFYGLFLGINYGISKRIKPIEIIDFSCNKAKNKILSSLSLFIMILWIIIILIGNLIGGFLGGITLGITFMLFFLLISGLNISEINTKKTPNQGIKKSAINAVFSGICSVLISLLVIGLSGGQSAGWSIGLMFLPNVPFIFCFSGGKSLIQHFSLRLILYFNGYIPWNYARFLDYCTERMLLQRVGGRYRFIHKLLQDHFAQMEFRRD